MVTLLDAAAVCQSPAHNPVSGFHARVNTAAKQQLSGRCLTQREVWLHSQDGVVFLCFDKHFLSLRALWPRGWIMFGGLPNI